jgi:RNA polymerase sigma-70 factor (ECF subfamily)
VSLDLAECTDGELAALALGGRQRAFTALMERHQAPIYRLVRSHVGNGEEALDVTQQSFVAAFAALKRYDAARPFRIWLSRIAINKCHDWARRRAVRRMFSFALPLSNAEQVAEEAVPVDAAMAHSQELDAAMRAISELPSSLKEPLILRTIENLSQSETAQVLGISEKAVETRLYRARARLTKILRV